MEPGVSFLVWILVVVIIFLIVYLIGVNWWAALALALLIGAFVLAAIYPFRSGSFDGSNSLASLIIIVSLIIAFIYFLVKVFSDRRK